MAQVNNRKKDAATYSGVEGTYGTGATTARLSIVSDSWEANLDQPPVAVDAESSELYDHQSPIFGLQTGEAKFDLYVRPPETAPMTTGTMTAPAQLSLMHAWLGGLSPAAGGNTGAVLAASAGTATAIEVVSAANLAAGQWILVQTANGLEPGRISTIASTTVNLNPGLSTTPTNNGVVASMANLYPTPGVDSCSSVTLEHTTLLTTNQQRLLGCIGDFEWRFAQNEPLKCGVTARAAKWERGSLSLATSVGSDTAGLPFALVDGAKFLLQGVATATATHVPIEEITMKMATGLAHTPDIGGAVNGTAGITRVGERMAAEWVVTMRTDEAQMTAWAAQTYLQAVLMVPRGTGVTRQYALWSLPRATIEGKPKRVYSGDGRERYAITLRSQIDTSLSTALLKAPWIHAVG